MINANGKIKKRFELLWGYFTENPSLVLAFVLIIIVGVLFRFYVCFEFGTIQRDEGQHSLGGIFISRFFLNNIGDPGSYVADYPTTIGSFWFYPFGYSLLTAFVYPFFGYNEFAARLPSLIFSLLLIRVTANIAKEIEPNKRITVISAFFVATSSIIVIVGSGAMVDIPVTALMMYAILFWIRGIRNHSDNALLKAGILGGIAGLMKPTGFFVLLFMIAFHVLAFLISKNNLILTKGFWKGMISGFLIFSTWWGSAVLLNLAVNGWVGEEALRGTAYWFDISGVFGKYVPPWYSPPWYRIEAWSYYPDQLISIMGILPFVFAFVGVNARFRKMKMIDALLILFALCIYVLQTFTSNKNPRYIIPCLPILYVYSSIGLNAAYTNIVDNNLVKINRIGVIKKLAALSLVLLVLFGGFMPMLSAVKANYIQGMWYSDVAPIQESLQVIRNDGRAGIIMPDSEDNLFNVQTLTFYIASSDYDRKFGCHSPPLKPQMILLPKMGEKETKYVLVHDSGSEISMYIQSNPEHFTFIGKGQNSYGIIYVYRVED